MYTQHNWLYNYIAKYQYNINSSRVTTTDKFYTQGSAKYHWMEKKYILAAIDYTDDRFDGFNYIINTNVGVGRNIIQSEKIDLDIYIGPGARFDETRNNNDKRTLPAIVCGADLGWNITSNLRFTEKLTNYIATKIIEIKSVSSLVTPINSYLKFSISYDLEYITKPVSGNKRLNTTTLLNLIYSI